MNKKLVAVLSVALTAGALTGAALAANPYTPGAGVSTSPHNMNQYFSGTTGDAYGRVCAYCHTPHHASTDAFLTNRNPLWAHDVSQTDFAGKTYTSTTLDAQVGADPAIGATRLCMSCHDGSVTIGQHYGNDPGNGSSARLNDTWGGILVGDANVTYLTNDHPIGFAFSDVAGKEKNGQASTSNVMIQGIKDASTTFTVTVGGTQYTRSIQDLLYKNPADSKYYMTCNTCHDVHNKTNPEQYLLVNMESGSTICLTCHNK
jgi:predicted CXXCH cytochrome family protein